MSIENYIVKSDKFEEDDRQLGELCFPCCVCKNNKLSSSEDPCINCGHNLNADIGQTLN